MTKNVLSRPWVFILVVALGMLVAYTIIKSRTPVTHEDLSMVPVRVQVQEVSQQPFQSQVVAYGIAQPAVELNTKAEVSGKIGYLHPDLKSGNSIQAGTVVVRIDQEDFEVSLKQSEADLSANSSSLRQLEVEEASARRSLALAQENLRVGEKELERVNEIFARKLIAKSTVDVEEQKVIQLRQQVEDLQGKLNAYVSRKANTKAQISRAEQQVKGQQTTLGRTEVVMPFDARIGDVAVEVGEFVSQGTTLFQVTDFEGVEIEAQLSVSQIAALFTSLGDRPFDISAGSVSQMMSRTGIHARVRLVGMGEVAFRDARLLRIGEAIDETRRTVTLVVAVDQPYSNILPGKRPPLIKGMFTEVELTAPEISRIVIPRRALHGGRAYLMGQDDTLEIREVSVEYTQGDDAVIAGGLKAGERIVISDLTPVIPGMPLSSVARAETAGEESVK